MDSSTWQLFAAGGLILVLGLGAYLFYRRDQRMVSGRINPAPKVSLAGISKEDQQERARFVMTQVNDLNQVPWGEHAIDDRREAERMYQSALDAIVDAEGDYRKLIPVVDELQKLPIDLALSGVARIVMTLAYFRSGQYAPVGVQAALSYTSAAVNLDPLSVDAWIMRLLVATSVPDSKYRLIARDALKRVQTLNPNHPRFPDAESKYYDLYGTSEQYKTALLRMLELAPSPVVKRAAYDRLAMYYARRGQIDEAIATYQRYFREYPEGSAWTWHNYSLILLNAKRQQEALDASNRALTFFEFAAARSINNEARAALGMPPVKAPIEADG
jgi:tetratricopeptide (TPR) repeat protein